MIKLEPLSDVAEGAMRDDERLRDANMANRDHLLDRLRSATAVFEAPEANNYLRYLPKSIEFHAIGKLESPNGDAAASGIDPQQLRTKVIERVKSREEIKQKLRPEAIAILVETRRPRNRPDHQCAE